MRPLHIAWLMAIALAISATAHAQTMVVACQNAWGSSYNCGGCSGVVATAADANDYVKSDASDFWQKLSSLASTANVSIVTGKTEGQTVACSDISGTKTVAELLGSTSTTPPPPPPPTSTGNATISWTYPPQCTDGSPTTNCAVTGWLIEYGQTDFSKSVNVGATVVTYTFTGIATGQWQARVSTLAGTQQSSPSNPVTFTVSSTTTPPPATVDCVVSAWSDWVLGTWGSCLNGSQSRIDTRTRTVVTPAANGGAACPALTETRTVSQTCVVTKPWKVAPSSTATTRPIYEPVLNGTGDALVRGTVQGNVPIGAPCGAEVYRVGSNSYRDIDESVIAFDSPTYKGRRHTAICTQQ